MGYRSQVAIRVVSHLENIFQAKLKESDLDSCNESEARDTFVHNSIKWYDSDEGVTMFMKWLNKLDDDEFGFIRIGEELGDVEIYGNPYNLGLGYRCEIEID